MLTRILTLFVCLVVIPIMAPPAGAQVACLAGKAEDTLAMWYARTGQSPLIQMQMSAGNEAPTMPAILSVDGKGQWTLLILNPEGNVCILAVGSGMTPAAGDGFTPSTQPGTDS